MESRPGSGPNCTVTANSSCREWESAGWCHKTISELPHRAREPNSHPAKKTAHPSSQEGCAVLHFTANCYNVQLAGYCTATRVAAAAVFVFTPVPATTTTPTHII